jgi:hypothetical protein
MLPNPTDSSRHSRGLAEAAAGVHAIAAIRLLLHRSISTAATDRWAARPAAVSTWLSVDPGTREARVVASTMVEDRRVDRTRSTCSVAPTLPIDPASNGGRSTPGGCASAGGGVRECRHRMAEPAHHPGTSRGRCAHCSKVGGILLPIGVDPYAWFTTIASTTGGRSTHPGGRGPDELRRDGHRRAYCATPPAASPARPDLAKAMSKP